MSARVGVVVGLAAEARLLASPPFEVRTVGGHRALAQQAAKSLARDGVAGLVSFGICGGIAPGVTQGDLVLPDAVIWEGGHAGVHRAWRDRVADALSHSGTGPIYGTRSVVVSVSEKRDLHQRTGAVGVDMESEAVAEVASEHQLPFIVLRAVADGPDEELPPAARIPLRPNGTPDLARVLGCILAAPGQIGALIRLAGETRTAIRRLRTLPAAAIAALGSPPASR